MAFAKKLSESFGDIPFNLESAKAVSPFQLKETGSGGSTDVGDVSWVVPTAGMQAATWVPGTPAHSWQAVASGGTSIGNKGMIVAAKTLAMTAADVFTDAGLAKRAQEELIKRRGNNFKYESLVGDRKPPLNYRD
jgi:aminobenzoyl-glutamate utilization protein B